eukprot:TRINITY_DN50570_c0_g1_i1.p1 TRINITY_DN50570_c0_g1~~TRINITY_DN50570_c0_g1_i1.p1  ORF type:complete len:451 (-),score=71.61 TRINITY_DN50570_c0_g1_i1:35-1387(-)
MAWTGTLSWYIFFLSTLHLAPGVRRDTSSDDDVDVEQGEHLCTEDLIEDSCAVMGGETMDHLKQILAVDDSEAKQLLSALGLDSFTCETLCVQAISHIPSILNAAIPKHAEESCLDSDCNETIDVSVAALKKVGMSSVGDEKWDSTVISNESSPSVRHKPNVQQMLHRLLLVVFRVFPAPLTDIDEDDDENAGASLLEGEFDPVFGVHIQHQNKKNYRHYNVEARTWVSAAIQNIQSRGRPLVKKWFNVNDDQVEVQLTNTLRLLNEVLDVFGHLYLKRGEQINQGRECRMNPSGTSGVVAFVGTRRGCHVSDWRACGSKINGRFVIYICQFYWHRLLSRSSRIGTLVHEATHHFGTKDHSYCGSDGQGCLALSFEEAKQNADTYTEFVKELVLTDQYKSGTRRRDHYFHRRRGTSHGGINPVSLEAEVENSGFWTILVDFFKKFFKMLR